MTTMKPVALTLLLLLCIPLLVHGQDWHVLPHDTLFLRDSTGHIVAIEVQNRELSSDGEMLALAPSPDVNSRGSLPRRIYKQLLERKGILHLYHPTLIGADIRMMDNGDAYFRDTLSGDSMLVKTKAALNNTWPFDAKRNSQAVVTGLSHGSLFGIVDSFKEITVRWGDSVLKITLSKNEGLVATQNLFTETSDSMPTYWRTNDPRLNHRQVNDFEIGDIFHSTYQEDVLYSGKLIDTIVSKKVSADSLTVTYGIKRLKEEDWGSRLTTTHTLQAVSLNYSEQLIYKELPGVLYMTKESGTIWYYTCFDAPKYFPAPFMRSFYDMFDNLGKNTFYTGAGAYSYRSLESESGDTYSHLKYYKKGTDEWGDQVVLSTLSTLIPSTLQIYPNPAAGFLVVQGLEATQEATVYNAIGQIERVLELSNGMVDLSTLAEGTYYLRLENGQMHHFIKG